MSRQQTLFDVAEYDELCEANNKRLARALASRSLVEVGVMAVNTRLEIIVSILKGLRVLPPEFEYLYEQEMAKRLEELL